MQEKSPQALIARIEEVFPERPLPDMTLRQGQLADETLEREIPQDEWDAAGGGDHAVSWKDIQPAVLVACDAALSHLSEAGFVYYVPAYMRLALNQPNVVADREWEAYGSTVFHLTPSGNYSLARFKRFSDSQIETVIEFLRHIRATGGFEGKMAAEALAAYWETPEVRRRTLIQLP